MLLVGMCSCARAAEVTPGVEKITSAGTATMHVSFSSESSGQTEMKRRSHRSERGNASLGKSL